VSQSLASSLSCLVLLRLGLGLSSMNYGMEVAAGHATLQCDGVGGWGGDGHARPPQSPGYIDPLHLLDGSRREACGDAVQRRGRGFTFPCSAALIFFSRSRGAIRRCCSPPVFVDGGV
jgi:hypothetical protein